MRKSLSVFIGCFALLVAPAQEARAQWVVTDPPLTAIQASSKVQQLIQVVQEIQTALRAVQMATMMVQEGQQLIQHPSTNIIADLSMLSSILVQSQGLAGTMVQMNRQWQNTFGSYNGPNQFQQYALAYNNWTTTALKTLNGNVNSAGYSGQMLQNTAMWTQQMQMLNQTSMGRDQSIQLGNTIALQEIAQLQSLNQIMQANGVAYAAAEGTHINNDQASTTAAVDAFTHTNWAADPRIW